jgi:hypothetical protein
MRHGARKGCGGKDPQTMRIHGVNRPSPHEEKRLDSWTTLDVTLKMSMKSRRRAARTELVVSTPKRNGVNYITG